MAKITRKHQKIFAGSATNNGVFGSAQVGTKVLSTDPDVIQGLAAFNTGWNSATISSERLPTIEEMQGLQFLQTRQLAYILQEGVAEYDVGTEYHVNSIVKKAATYELYGSIINTNTGNALGVQADTANWKYLGDLAGLKNAGAAGNLTGAVTSVGLATSLGSFTSAALLAALTDETGTGAAVFAGSPTFTGTPTLPTGTIGVTQAAGDNSTKLATTAFVAGAAVAAMAINGFLPSSITGTNTTATLTVSAGQATDTTGAAKISKASTTAWAVSNGNAINGYSGGATLPNSSTIHFYACTGGTGTGVYAIPNSAYPLAAASAPAGYNTSVRRIFSLTTTGAGALIPFAASSPTETSGGSINCKLATQVLDISTAALGTSRTLFALSVPLGIKVEPLIRFWGTANLTSLIITGGDETDVAPSASSAGTTVPLFSGASSGYPVTISENLLCNTSGQIGARANAASQNLYLVTRGFIDFRRD